MFCIEIQTLTIVNCHFPVQMCDSIVLIWYYTALGLIFKSALHTKLR